MTPSRFFQLTIGDTVRTMNVVKTKTIVGWVLVRTWLWIVFTNDASAWCYLFSGVVGASR